MNREAINSIELKDVSFVAQDGTSLFADVCLSVPLEGIVWLKGSSGSGKSVLVKMICGLVRPTSGQILINNKVMDEMTFEEFSPLRCNMGYSFDFGGLINNKNIMANLLMANEYHKFEFGSPDFFVKQIARYMEVFNLKNVAFRRPSEIVGGLRKAACVARAFVHQPELLLLDDPTTGLRGETRAKLKELIVDKIRNKEIKHVIIATDDVEFMKDMNATVVEINHGDVQIEKKVRAA